MQHVEQRVLDDERRFAGHLDVPRVAMKEREAKFLVTSRSVPVDLGARPEVFGFKVGPVRVVEQSDVYFDTADLRLDAAGEALRIRRRGGSRLFTFKGVSSGGDFMVREEIEEEVPEERSLPDWVEELARKGGLEVRFAPGQLNPMLSVDNRRTVIPLSSGDGTLIEVSLDEVRFHGPSDESRHQELEVELKSGSELRFEEFCGWIETAYRLEPSTESKYRRGLRTVCGVERPGGSS